MMKATYFIKYSLAILLIFNGEIGKCVQNYPFFNVKKNDAIGDSMASYSQMNRSFSDNTFILKNIYPGMKGLIKRTVPAWTDKFIIDSIAKENDKDVFEIESENNKIVLRGSSITACSYAFNWYLKYYCFVDISQAGKPASLPLSLPEVKEKIHRVSPFQYRYYFNYCTFNYTMAFWSWEQWQKELDWMALNGVNLALSTVGTEAVWQNTLRRFNFSESEIFDFIPGPAFQAWWLMGNLEGYDGPVTQKYIDKRVELQKKILARMNELGIQPLFQGFYGIVPNKLKQKYPNAVIYSTGDWHSFRRPDILNPLDLLFDNMAGVYYDEYKKLFGRADFYGGDPFHEGGSTNGIDVTKSAAKIQTAMQKACPGSTWVLMAWQENPSERLLAGVNKNQTLILNLGNNSVWAKTKELSDFNSIYCDVNNYGANTVPYGNIEGVTVDLYNKLNGPYKNNLKGIGLMPEGNRLDPLTFDYFFELAWHQQPPDLKKWITNYPAIRYGKPNETASEAWQVFINTIYKSDGCSQPVFCARPSLTVDRVVTWGTTKMFYKASDLLKGCQLLFKCANDFKNIDTYLYDLVDFTHLSVSHAGLITYNTMVKAYHQRDLKSFIQISDQFIKLMNLQNRLMACRSEFSLASWVDDARKQASTPEEQKLFVRNALDLITLWGDESKESLTHDYSYREWTGMMDGFYLPRWQMFITYLENDLQGKQPNPVDFYNWEKNWINTANIRSENTNNSVIETVKETLEMIAPIIQESANDFQISN
jgi:alpha-N-acetylglucosaminidase